MKNSITWMCSDGGPLIVAPAEIAPQWRGDRGWFPTEDGHGESASDYARACSIDGYLGTLEVGSGRALILGAEPMRTCFVPNPDGGVLVRWMYAENEDSVRRALEAVPESAWGPTPHWIEVGQEGILVFDSAYPGDDLPTPTPEEGQDENEKEALLIRIELPSGTYLVDTADYEPDGATRLILHRLRAESG